MATVGWMPAKRISSGVISEPPPSPVIPMSSPTPSPKAMISGSIASSLCHRMQAAFGPVLSGPSSLTAGARLGARDAADRVVAPVVQRVVRQLVLGDVPPHIAVAPVRQRVDLPAAVGLVPLELGGAGAGARLLAARAG